MLKKTMTYTNYNGVEVTEDFYFNLTRSELMEMEISTAGGYTDMVQKIIKAQDQASLIKIFKELILKAYGEKSSDGRRFMKSKEISEAFSQTEAYDQLFMELAMDDDKAAEFMNGLIPADVRKQIEANSEANSKEPVGFEQ